MYQPLIRCILIYYQMTTGDHPCNHIFPNDTSDSILHHILGCMIPWFHDYYPLMTDHFGCDSLLHLPVVLLFKEVREQKMMMVELFNCSYWKLWYLRTSGTLVMSNKQYYNWLRDLNLKQNRIGEDIPKMNDDWQMHVFRGIKGLIQRHKRKIISHKISWLRGISISSKKHHLNWLMMTLLKWSIAKYVLNSHEWIEIYLKTLSRVL